MNLPEFKALKAEVIKRASSAVECYGTTTPAGRELKFDNIQIHYVGGGFRIFVIRSGERLTLIFYEDVNGNEIPVRMKRSLLVVVYRLFLRRLQRHLVLDALADV